MGRADLEKYIERDVESIHVREIPELSVPALHVVSDEKFGNHRFRIAWCPVPTPFVMVPEAHTHDFDQYLFFMGGDASNLMDLGGEAELMLGEDPDHMEAFTITEPCMVWVKAGLYHCPLTFKKINDPKKPILFHDMVVNGDAAHMGR